MSLKSNTQGFSSCNVDVLFSITDKLVPCIITAVIYEMLQSTLDKEGGVGNGKPSRFNRTGG